jgi:DNA-binding response OmpR family regulator
MEQAIKPRILLLEDEAEAALALQDFLEIKGFVVAHFANGQSALHALQEKFNRFSLAILDVMVPGADGMQVLKHIRQASHHPELPVLLLTAKDQEMDEISGLQAGADDYVTKPASLHLIGARIDNLLRRRSTATQAPTEWQLGILAVSATENRVRLGGNTIPCTLSEFILLRHLLENAGQVYTRQQLVQLLTNDPNKFVFDRTVDVHIKNLRAKLATQDELIRTVRGVGYSINPDFRQ